MILVGVVLAVLAAAIGTTSKQLIAASGHLKKPWLFHLGASMNILLGPLVDASAYAFAPQVIIAPFACLDVIFNAITAPYTLRWQHERLTRAHWCGTGLVAIGAVFTSVFAQAGNIIRDVYELEAQLFLRPTSLAYLAVEACAILSVNLALRRKLLSPAVRGIGLGIIAGCLMGNIFFLKGVIGLIQVTMATGNFEAWWRPTPYILAAAAAGGAVLGHVFMRKGLGEYKGVFMITIFEGAHITAGCLSGCIVMEEMAGAPWWRYLAYWLSVSLIIAGMLIINKRSADAQMEEKLRQAQSFVPVPGEKREEHELDPPAGVGHSGDVELGSPVVTIGRDLEDHNAGLADPGSPVKGGRGDSWRTTTDGVNLELGYGDKITPGPTPNSDWRAEQSFSPEDAV